jgi:membrane protease YdiL (CAAX protease family)
MRILTGVLVAVFLLVLVDLPGRGVVAAFASSLDVAPWWLMPVVRQGTELLMALLAIAVIWRGEFRRFGFRLSGNLKIWRSVLASLPLFVLGILVGGLIASLITILVGSTPSYDFGSPSLLQQIVKIWLLASITEEIVFRGLIQTYLSSRLSSSFSIFRIRITHAALIAAILFSLAHLVLLTRGAGAAQMAAIVVSTLVLGVAAGYFRENTGSLIPAIIIHVLFNVWGSGLGLLVPGAP